MHLLKRHSIVSVIILAVCSCTPQLKTKTIDAGGNGPYSAIAVTEPGFEDYVIYRPKLLAPAVQNEQALPVVVFANGGCNDTSLPFEKMLSEIASHGYLVIALGAMQSHLDDRKLLKADNSLMTKAVDWFEQQNNSPNSHYYQSANLNRLAFAGQSCGGAQVLAMAKEPRVSTYLMFNSGIGDMTMAGANQDSLQGLHSPVIYLVGGPTDIATENAKLDYERIDHVPVVFANHLTAGHSGTFEHPFGGSFAQLALHWLDWHLKGYEYHSELFLAGRLDGFPEWNVKAKNFPSKKL